MVGLDTGFFIQLMRRDQVVIDIWNSVSSEDSIRPVVSVLTLGELLYIAYRTGQPDAGKALVDNIDVTARIVTVDRSVVEKAAALKAGRSIPYIDSLILASLMVSGCKKIHTTDRTHFAEIKNKGIKFIFH